MGITNLGAVSISAGGVYNSETVYKKYKVVSANGCSYMYINPTPAAGVPVTDTSHWQQIASIGGQDLVDAAVAARDVAQAQAVLAQGYATQLAAGTASPAGTYANLSALASDNPNHAKIYITLDDGKWCYWNGSAWVAGGVYQATSDHLESKIVETVSARYEDTSAFGLVDHSFTGWTFMQGYNSSESGVHALAGFDTWTMIAQNDFEIYMPYVPVPYFSITLYSNGVADNAHYIMRYRAANNNLPVLSNKVQVHAGDMVAITTNANDISWYFMADYSPAIGMYLINSMSLNTRHLEQAASAIKQNKVVYYGSTETNNGLFIYIPTGVGYVRYDFKHAYNTSTNADNWRINSVYSVDDNLSNRFHLTTSGEMECALRLSGRPDFIGGIMHGDEVVTDLRCFVDGGLTSLSSLRALKSFSELKIVQVSTLYDPLDSVTVVATHGKEYIFTKDKLVVNQYVVWSVNATLGVCYLAMLTTAKADGDLVVTDTFYHDKDYAKIDCAAVINTRNGTIPNAKKVMVYSSHSGLTATMAIPVYPSGMAGGDSLDLIDNGGGDYNKFYFDVCASGSVVSGDRWDSQTVYTFEVGEGTDVK